MTIIESQLEQIEAPLSQVMTFLKNPENYRVLMPSSVRSFKVEDQHAILNIQGLGDLTLKIDGSESDHEVRIVPIGKTPFDFHLDWKLQSVESGCTAQLVISADLNMMMKMMAGGFLKDFAETQVYKLSKQFKGN